ncbi:MAG: flagellar hook-basal body complex protein FliE [Clostridia bacterium]|nr:flagellar hook-basal body complex protein FliE [Clostridia bacterium]
MKFLPIQMPSVPLAPVSQVTNNQKIDGDSGFGEMLKKAIDDVNTLQKQSQEAKVKMATGEVEDLHSVMIAGAKASIAMQFTLQVRNKVIESYQEIMRMQI